MSKESDNRVERVIVIMPRDLLDSLEGERKHSPGASPSRAALVRELLREALKARTEKRGGAPTSGF